ncbi:MAG: FoF1 ATP synthase subunit gamma [Longimicrobiales bacterium]|nr:FoF1 ATP synthase subunit gamma [Longimicrobiales bacterium]
MLTLEQLRRQVQSAEDLHSITRAMKALAAVRIRQSRQAVESLDRFRRTVELGLHVALRNRPRGIRLLEDPEPGRGVGVVVFGSDLGLAGRFNIRITDHALEILDAEKYEGEERVTLAVGARVAGQLEARGQPVARTFPAPDSIEAVTPTVQELLVAIDRMRSERGLDRFQLFYNHYHSGATYRPHRVHLLPVNVDWLRGIEERPWPTRVLPTFRVPWNELFAALVREHLFVGLYAACALSQASENASRLASMEAAERRIEERLEGLQGRFNQQRQQRITEELLDLLTGYLAVEEEDEEEDGPDTSDQGEARPAHGPSGAGPFRQSPGT